MGKKMNIVGNRANRPFPSFHKPLFQCEAYTELLIWKLFLYSHANKTHLHKKGFALSLVLKVRVFMITTNESIELIPFALILNPWQSQHMRSKLNLQELQTWHYKHLPKGGLLLWRFELRMFVMETEEGKLAWNFKDMLNLVINYLRQLSRLAFTTIVYFKRCFKNKKTGRCPCVIDSDTASFHIPDSSHFKALFPYSECSCL